MFVHICCKPPHGSHQLHMFFTEDIQPVGLNQSVFFQAI